MNILQRSCCLLTWTIMCSMISAPVMAEDLYLVRFLSGKEVIFALTPDQVKIVTGFEWKELREITAQAKQVVKVHVEAPYVGIGTVRWIDLKQRLLSSPIEGEQLRFELLSNGTVYDRSRDKILVLSCPGTIKAFAIREAMQRLVVLNREVTRYFHDREGNIIGAAFSGEDELTLVGFTGEVVRKLPLQSIGAHLLDIDNSTAIPVIHSVYSTNWLNPLNWFRSFAGHPKQSQRIVISIFDLSGVRIDSLQLAEVEPAQEFSLFKIIR